jgi:hypothetical protein
MKYIVNAIHFCYTCLVLSIIPILLLSAYSQRVNSPIYIHPEFKPFFEKFVTDAATHNAPLRLNGMIVIFSLTNSQDGVVAYCLPSTNTIVFYPNYWQIMSTFMKEVTLRHELSHCALKREHVTDAMPLMVENNTCPISIMYPYMDAIEPCYIQFEKWYTEEMFTNPFNYPTF